ncbi:hypothetical protein [Brucella oryzae]|uniref:Uncharacterized protein n=1 Tax=Brucella intermedia TaxID=94625 RepID=A0A7V6PBK6_9HYPH|nr:hypothetical protein [Brucella intermedia]MCH4544158.1 hypothetical protein [Ochrobactrum sp. A-1]HHV67908.1 hypothetical protein [Brucella intermedia]
MTIRKKQGRLLGVCLTAPPLYSPVLAHRLTEPVRPRASLHNGQHRHASVPIPACSGQGARPACFGPFG